MNPEIEKALKELREAVGQKDVAALARIESIETLARSGEATTKELRSAVDTLKGQVTEAQQTIEAIRREGRRQMVSRDGITDRRQGFAVLGALCRQALAGHLRVEVPSAFREVEQTLIREYNESLSRATLEAGSGSGAFLVPTVTETEMIDSLEEVSDVLSKIDMNTGLPGNVNIPVLTGRPLLRHSRATVDTNMTQSDPSMSELQIRPEELYIFVPVDNRLLGMSAIALGAMMTTLLRDGAVEGLARYVVAGGGPAGFDSIMGAAAAYRYSLPAGKMAFEDFTYMDAVKARASVLKRGRARGVWLAADDVLNSWGDITRGTGKIPLVTAGPDGSRQVLFNPAVSDEDMPDLSESAADTVLAAFGDLATMYAGLQGGMAVQVSTENLFQRNQTAFRLVMNADIKRKPVRTLVTLRTAAA